ncbi:MAG: hypothetical protein ACT4QC_02545 [Planctomycetaceae bacterium]
MDTPGIASGVISGLLLTAALLADEPAVPPARPDPPAGRAERDAARHMRLHLMEGSVVTGRLSIEALLVETEFGRLEIPVASILSFTPGLDSHPEERKKITRLIQQLGSNSAAERDAAQKSLSEIAHAVQPELVRYANDEDVERRTQIQKILAELEEADADDESESGPTRPWIAQDVVETTRFTVVGKIAPHSFGVETPFGPLQVSINDIRRGEREADQKPEIRKAVDVSGAHLAHSNMLATGVRLARGDKVSLTADGKIVMSPWGNNAVSTPDGSETFQWFIPNQIPGGCLVARVGTAGKTMKIGSKQSFTATRSGILFLGVAMNPQFSSGDFNFPGEYKVRIRVNPR